MSVGDKIVFHHQKDGVWCKGLVVRIMEKDGEIHYGALCDGHDEDNEVIQFVRRTHLIGVNESQQLNDVISFGTIVLADGDEYGLEENLYYDAQVIGMDSKGRYKIYYLGSGEIAFMEKNKVVMNPMRSFHPSSKIAFSSCEDFVQYLFFHLLPRTTDFIIEEIGANGCLVVHSYTNDSGSSLIIVSYDGQRHFEMNLFSPNTDGNFFDVARDLSNPTNLPGFTRTQIDIHPRGYGRVVTFLEDLKKPYFGTYNVKDLFD